MKSYLSKTILVASLTTLLVNAPAPHAQAQYTPVFFDGFEITNPTQFDPNTENSTRQGGVLSPINYQVNPESAYQFWQLQLKGSVLQLAGTPNPFAVPVGKLVTAMASPDYDFTGLNGGDVVGKRISLWLDATVSDPNGNPLPYGNGAGIVIAGSTNAIEIEGIRWIDYTNYTVANSSFGIRFREDNLMEEGWGYGNFLQLYDGTNLVGNLIPNPAGTNGFNADLIIDDPADGNPWDGVGSTKIDVYIDQAWVASYTKGDGGYTNNIVTLLAEWGAYGTNLPAQFATTINYFDNFLVYAAPTSAHFNLLSIPTAVGGDYKFDLFGFPSYNYALEVASDLSSPTNWTAVVTNLADPTGLVSFTNTPSGAAQFYRTRGVGY